MSRETSKYRKMFESVVAEVLGETKESTAVINESVGDDHHEEAHSIVSKHMESTADKEPIRTLSDNTRKLHTTAVHKKHIADLHKHLQSAGFKDTTGGAGQEHMYVKGKTHVKIHSKPSTKLGNHQIAVGASRATHHQVHISTKQD